MMWLVSMTKVEFPFAIIETPAAAAAAAAAAAVAEFNPVLETCPVVMSVPLNATLESRTDLESSLLMPD